MDWIHSHFNSEKNNELNKFSRNWEHIIYEYDHRELNFEAKKVYYPVEVYLTYHFMKDGNWNFHIISKWNPWYFTYNSKLYKYMGSEIKQVWTAAWSFRGASASRPYFVPAAGSPIWRIPQVMEIFFIPSKTINIYLFDNDMKTGFLFTKFWIMFRHTWRGSDWVRRWVEGGTGLRDEL